MKKTIASNRIASKSIASSFAGMSVDHFLKQYWQREPIVLKAAFAQFVSPVSIQQVLDEARLDHSQSRLISCKNDQWTLTQAPLPKLPPLSRKDWTVLLQGADTHWDSIAAILAQFRFIPDARLDDLMISVASDGGGVGPHIDSYDVFLLQAHGQRHWHWSKPKNTQWREDQPIKLLSQFDRNGKGVQQAILEPGDMLYLPPGWAHDGIALGACMTFSIGFRSITQPELISEFLGRVAGSDTQTSKPQLHTIPSLALQQTVAAKEPAQIPTQMISTYRQWISDWRPTVLQMDQVIGQMLSEPRDNVVFNSAERKLTPLQFLKLARLHGLRLNRASKALFTGKLLFINGEALTADQFSSVLVELFNHRKLTNTSLNALTNPAPEWSLLLDWYDAGWIETDL
jgi:50S ribosomal protein L16 3-hydroxylase